MEELAPEDLEAADWLVRLTDQDFDAEEPYPDLGARQRAFHDWICQSPANVRAVFEILTAEQWLREIDVQAVLGRQSAEVIRLFDRQNGPSQAPLPAPAGKAGSRRRTWWRVGAGMAAGMTLLLMAAGLYFDWAAAEVYATAVGEQRVCKLADGSVIYLNTDSRVLVRFHRRVRDIWLQRGEALFVVEHDKARPFIVHAGSSAIQAVGTQFDVYRGEHTTKVSVVEGVVQVSTAVPSSGEITSPLRVASGEQADIRGGHIAATAVKSIEDAISWRERRLVFTNATLGEVAREFNRYNSEKIIVEGAADDRLHLTGIFNADRPQALLRYVSAYDSLTVEQKGDNWFIGIRR